MTTLKEARGYFYHQQCVINDIAKVIDEKIDAECYKHETVKQLQEAIKVLRLAYTYTYRIDRLFSGDVGEEIFLRRLQADLAELKAQNTDKRDEEV